MAFDKSDRTTLYLFVSLSTGSRDMVTRTSRLETVLKANKVPFMAIDVATDEQARRVWARRSNGRMLPGLVKDGDVVGDYKEVDEWNEYGELKWKVGLEPAPGTLSASATTTTIPGEKSTAPKANVELPQSSSSATEKAQKKEETPINPTVGNLAAEVAAAAKKKKDDAAAAAKK